MKQEELKKPPVIEAWIGFQFQYGEEPPLWNENRAETLIKECFGDTFKKKDFGVTAKVEFGTSGGRPVLSEPELIFERIRAVTEKEDRFIQAGRSWLVYNLLRKGRDWPGFPTLREEALETYDKYIKFLRPDTLQLVSLHYRDLILIPTNEMDRIKIEDYFTVCPGVPDETFGVIGRFVIDLILPEMFEDGTLRLIMKDQPMISKGNEPSSFRFLMDWHITSNKLFESLSNEIVIGWLDNAHDVLYSAFKESFTKRGWQLFNQEEI